MWKLFKQIRTFCKYNKPICRVTESILSKYWNIKWTSWHGGDILVNKYRKRMFLAWLLFDQISEFLLEGFEDNIGSEQAQRELKKRCDIIAKALLLFGGLLYLLRTSHNYLIARKIQKSQRYINIVLQVWRILQLSVTTKCHKSEYNAYNQLEWPSRLL